MYTLEYADSADNEKMDEAKKKTNKEKINPKKKGRVGIPISPFTNLFEFIKPEYSFCSVYLLH